MVDEYTVNRKALAWSVVWSLLPINLYGFLLINHSESYLGGMGTLTSYSLGVVGAFLFLLILASLLYRRWPTEAVSLVNIAVVICLVYTFLSLSSDWFITLLLIGINTSALAYCPSRLQAEQKKKGPEDPHWWVPCEIWFSLMALALLLLTQGHQLGENSWALLIHSILIFGCSFPSMQKK